MENLKLISELIMKSLETDSSESEILALYISTVHDNEIFAICEDSSEPNKYDQIYGK